MFIAYVLVTVVTVLANAWASFADFAHLRFVDKNMAEMGVPRSWLPALATMKAAGAAGLCLGLFSLPLIGTAAAAGLVMFFIGALVAHVRRASSTTSRFLALAAGSLALSVAR